jgi:hypothetical protein
VATDQELHSGGEVSLEIEVGVAAGHFPEIEEAVVIIKTGNVIIPDLGVIRADDIQKTRYA